MKLSDAIARGYELSDAAQFHGAWAQFDEGGNPCLLCPMSAAIYAGTDGHHLILDIIQNDLDINRLWDHLLSLLQQKVIHWTPFYFEDTELLTAANFRLLYGLDSYVDSPGHLMSFLIHLNDDLMWEWTEIASYLRERGC